MRETSPTTARFDRRTLLRGAGVASLAIGVPGMAACGSEDIGTEPINRGGTDTDSLLPKYLPYDGVEPDFPALESGVLAGFLKFPADPVDMGRPTPLSGGKITALCTLDGGAPA